MKKLINIVVFLTAALSLWAGQSGKTVVWENPVADENRSNHDGYFSCVINPTRVEFSSERTSLTFEFLLRPDFWFRMDSAVYLRAGDEICRLIGAEGVEINRMQFCPLECRRTFTLHFAPLPAGVERFDFIEPGKNQPFRIIGITDPSVTAQRIMDTNWRDETTGDWVIGFFRDGVIFDSRFWNYSGEKRPDTSSRFEISDGGESLTVSIGKLKKGKRKIRVGSEEMLCTMITSRTLPDYPQADTTAEFINTHYSGVDTVTVKGWLKDRPENAESYSARCVDLLTWCAGEDAVCDIDSLGRFTLKIAAENSTECFMDWNNTFIHTVLEPGRTYYLFYDFGRGQKLFMGRDCRVQNELLSYSLPWSSHRPDRVLKEKGPDAYLSASDSELQMRLRELDMLCDGHPTLSVRFRKYYTDHIYSLYASDLGQSKFQPSLKGCLTDSMSRYLSDMFRKLKFRPYTLHRDYLRYVIDFTEYIVSLDKSNSTLSQAEIMKCLSETELPAGDRANLDRIDSLSREYEKTYASFTDTVARKAYVEKFRMEYSGLMDSVNAMLMREDMRHVISTAIQLKGIRAADAVLDSLGADEELRSLMMTRSGHELMEHSRQSLMPQAKSYLCERIRNPYLLGLVMKENEKYEALERRAKDASRVTMVREIHTGNGIMATGQTLLDSIIAPHRGRIIILDVWGVWCGPCCAALAESQKEYAELAAYDPVYIYLANNSPEKAWLNTIEEYQVKGKNCYHYNLPAEQQEAIEKYLKVDCYPSYRLFDREGNLLQVNPDPRDLDSLKRLLERLRN